MKKLSVFALLLIFSTANAGMFDEFKKRLSGVADDVVQKRLDALCEDVGAVMVMTGFHQAGNLAGTLPGFDIGLHAGYKKTSDKNDIIKAVGIDALLLPVLQAELGIPYINTDLILRYTSYENSSLLGGGARYGLLKTIPFDLTFLIIYNKLNVSAGENKFTATSMTGSVGLNINMPVISPYLALSVDSAEIEPDSSITTKKSKTTLTRLDTGMNVSLMPFTYLNVGASYLISSEAGLGFRTGIGVKF